MSGMYPQGEHSQDDVEQAMATYSADGQLDDPSGNDAAQATLTPEQIEAANASSPYLDIDPDKPTEDRVPPSPREQKL